VFNYTKWSGAGEVVADTSAEVKFFAVDDNAGVPNAFNLTAAQLPRELGSHATRQIVNV